MNDQALRMIPSVSDTLPLPEVWIERLKNTPQNPRYHAEGSVYAHVMLVMEQFWKATAHMRLTPEEQEVLYWAVVLHDIGKPDVTKWVDGSWKAWGHEAAGVPVARQILLTQTQLSNEQRRKVLELVRFHNMPLSLGLRQAPLDDYRLFASATDLRLLGIFAEFDLRGRLCEAPDQIADLIQNFREVIEPKIRYEWGDFDEITQAYASASLRKKNALWTAWQNKDMGRITRLLDGPDLPGRPVPDFVCALTVGSPTLPENPVFLDRVSDRHVFDYDRDTTLVEGEEEKWRMLRHFLTIFGQTARKPLAVRADFSQENFRWQVAEYARQAGGEVELVVFETPVPEGPQAIWPGHGVFHPWEAHRISYPGL